MRDEHRGRLDRAIDRAVRGMVQVEPRPGLSRRVADRLERPVAGSFGWLPALATAATLVLLLTAFALYEPAVEDQGSSPDITASAPPAVTLPAADPAPEPVPEPVPAPAVAVRAAAPPQRVAPRGTAASIFGEPTGRVSAADIGSAPGAAPLDSGAEMELPAAPSTLVPLAPITIAPIRLAPISLRPVTVNARPGGR